MLLKYRIYIVVVYSYFRGNYTNISCSEPSFSAVSVDVESMLDVATLEGLSRHSVVAEHFTSHFLLLFVN